MKIDFIESIIKSMAQIALQQMFPNPETTFVTISALERAIESKIDFKVFLNGSELVKIMKMK